MPAKVNLSAPLCRSWPLIAADPRVVAESFLSFADSLSSAVKGEINAVKIVSSGTTIESASIADAVAALDDAPLGQLTSALANGRIVGPSAGEGQLTVSFNGRLPVVVAQVPQEIGRAKKLEALGAGHFADLMLPAEPPAREIAEALVATLEEMVAEGETHKEELRKHLGDARVIAEIQSNDAQTGKFAAAAQYHRRLSSAFRIAASLLAVVGAGVVAWALLQGEDPGLSHLLSAVSLYVPASYFAQQGGREREVAERYNRLAINLATADGFLALMPEDARHQLKARMFNHLFASAEPLGPSPPEGIAVGQLMEQVSKRVGPGR